jgi:hypothetical protein
MSYDDEIDDEVEEEINDKMSTEIDEDRIWCVKIKRSEWLRIEWEVWIRW